MDTPVTITPDSAQVTITPDEQPNSYGSGTLVDNPVKGVAAKALSSAGLPTSIANIPEWFSNLKNFNISHLFVEPVRKAIENPTKENIAGAVPLFGPVSVSMSKDIQEGKPQDALGSMLGFFGGLKGAGELKPGYQAAKSGIADIVRTPEGGLTPLTKAVAVAGGGYLGHQLVPGGEGGLAGVFGGPAVADAILPERAAVPTVRGGAYSEFAGESGKAVPISQSPKYPELQAARRAAMKEAADKLKPPEPIRTTPFQGMTSTAPAEVQTMPAKPLPSTELPGTPTLFKEFVNKFGKQEVAKAVANNEPLVMTPEEIAAFDQKQAVARKLASERGMQYAGGVRTAGPNKPANRLFGADE